MVLFFPHKKVHSMLRYQASRDGEDNKETLCAHSEGDDVSELENESDEESPEARLTRSMLSHLWMMHVGQVKFSLETQKEASC